MGVQDLHPLYRYIRPQNLTLDGRRQNWHKWACGGYSRGQDHVPQECTLKGIGPEYSYLWNSFNFKMTNLRRLKKKTTNSPRSLPLLAQTRLVYENDTELQSLLCWQHQWCCHHGLTGACPAEFAKPEKNTENTKLLDSTEVNFFFKTSSFFWAIKRSFIYSLGLCLRRWEISAYSKIPTMPYLIMTKYVALQHNLSIILQGPRYFRKPT